MMADSVKYDEKKSEFVCGVIEGFYGRPWTFEQRKDLFSKLNKWGLNSYLYAPKDDDKHRAYWRELYNDAESEHLKTLIAEAKKYNVTFYYALSPGLDFKYSSDKEVKALNEKIDQIVSLGCTAFALLYDDIPLEMSKEDEDEFHSFGNAQAVVTNQLFEYLKKPKFLFCPTQYCGTWADPTVKTSSYLQTLGRKLDPGIDILWTGHQIVSPTITVESIEEVAAVLMRPPVIWDNLHANDYDIKRVYLGPYTCRPEELKCHIKGALSNPNCEYWANFIGIHTLAQWSKTLAQDNILYDPKQALQVAIKEWVEEFKVTTPHNDTVQDSRIKSSNETIESKEITENDLHLLVDLFYLPYQHGETGVALIQEFDWLKKHSYLLKKDHSDTEAVSWLRLAEKFRQTYKKLEQFSDRFKYARNRSLFHELSPYLDDITWVIRLLSSHLDWLKQGKVWKGDYMKVSREPFVYRGGLAFELQLLLPMKYPHKDCDYQFPSPSPVTYIIRHYLPSDKEKLYQAYQDITLQSPAASSQSHPDLLPDVVLGGYLKMSPECSFTVECEEKITGYCFGVPDVVQFNEELKQTYFPELQEKYPKSTQKTADMIESLYKNFVDPPTAVLKCYKSSIHFGISESILDQSVPAQLVSTTLSLLKHKGSNGVHVTVQKTDKHLTEFYIKLGFTEIEEKEPVEDISYLGHKF